MTKTVAAEEFEQNVHTFLEAVEKGDEVIVERDGRVVARVLPRPEIYQGPMAGTVLYEGDIISPVTDPEDWDAMK